MDGTMDGTPAQAAAPPPTKASVDTVGLGGFRLAPSLATLETLAALCGFTPEDFRPAAPQKSNSKLGARETLLVIDTASENLDELEADPDTGLFPLVPGRRYTVATERELDEQDDDDGDGGGGGLSPERMAALHARALRMQEARERLIAARYTPKYPDVYEPIAGRESSVFCDNFMSLWRHITAPPAPGAAAAVGQEGLALDKLKLGFPALGLVLVDDVGPLFSLEVFRPEFCAQMIDEILNFEDSGLPLIAPNTMNNYGLILRDVGWTRWLDELRSVYLAPVARVLLPGELTESLDSEHTFVVEYRLGEDRGLNFHVDDSEATFNICLGREFTEGPVFFRGLLDEPSTHKQDKNVGHTVGSAILHFGRHRHGALPISSGERYNLIMWLRNDSLRQKRMLEESQGAEHEHEHAQDCGCGGHYGDDEKR